MTKRTVKLLTSGSAKNTEDESRNANRTAPLEEAEAPAEDKRYTPLGADESGIPMLPTPKGVVATEAEATRVTSVPSEPANSAPEPEPSTVTAKKVKAAKAKTEKKPAKTVDPTANTATLSRASKPRKW